MERCSVCIYVTDIACSIAIPVPKTRKQSICGTQMQFLFFELESIVRHERLRVFCVYQSTLGAHVGRIYEFMRAENCFILCSDTILGIKFRISPMAWTKSYIRRLVIASASATSGRIGANEILVARN